MKLPSKCPICDSIFIQAEPYGCMKIIKCLVRKCGWNMWIDPDHISKDDINRVKNIYLRITL